MPELILPDPRAHASFLEAMKEFEAEGRGGPEDNSMVGRDILRYGGRWHDPEFFAAYAAAVRADADEDSPRPEGHVPCTTLWWAEGDTYLGRIAIRHRLNGFLLDYGGHIGYDVRASARRRGHATAMLRAALPVAHSLGIDPVLVTCDDTNTASRRVIEKCGGVFEDRRGKKLRYWIATGPAAPRAPGAGPGEGGATGE
ncbi:GNAT family N-acetyltransferase [Streptomyces nanhaiensis]|uniref:GNAT family N-acetyltransferase n=1 Tax=Streptomyces nanhaiensis TaxID=679319 RepID=UPI00399CC165